MKYRDYDPDSFFLGYQRDWIKDQSRIKLMEKARQIGLSWSTAYAVVERKAQQGCRVDAWVSSRDDLQARLFKEDCNKFAEVLHLAAKDLGSTIIDQDRNISAYVLNFASGCRIHSMSSNPDAQAGKRGDRILDEFALHPDPRKLWSIAYPGITWGGVMEIISTHRGSQNLFNQLILEAREGGNPKGISLHRVTLQDALEYGFLAKLKTKLPKDDERQGMDEATYFDFIRAGCVDEESFLQEYMCCPSDDQSAFIGYELIDSNTYPIGFDWEQVLDPDKCYYMGYDVARTNDLSCMWINEANGSRSETRRVIVSQNEKFADQRDRLYRLLELKQVKRCCIDGSGLGKQIAEEARDRFGSKVEIVIFSNSVKEDLAVTLKRSMEDGNFKIPNNKEIIADFRSIRKSTTSAGNIRFEGERNANGHADRFWAAALGLHAAKQTGTVLPSTWGNGLGFIKTRRYAGIRTR